ncbi:hypothetical protein QUB47_36275, partial [Microcoleus sp. AT9_B5]
MCNRIIIDSFTRKGDRLGGRSNFCTLTIGRSTLGAIKLLYTGLYGRSTLGRSTLGAIDFGGDRTFVHKSLRALDSVGAGLYGRSIQQSIPPGTALQQTAQQSAATAAIL